jgi:hypothetical protein
MERHQKRSIVLAAFVIGLMVMGGCQGDMFEGNYSFNEFSKVEGGLAFHTGTMVFDGYEYTIEPTVDGAIGGPYLAEDGVFDLGKDVKAIYADETMILMPSQFSWPGDLGIGWAIQERELWDLWLGGCWNTTVLRFGNDGESEDVDLLSGQICFDDGSRTFQSQLDGPWPEYYNGRGAFNVDWDMTVSWVDDALGATFECIKNSWFYMIGNSVSSESGNQYILFAGLSTMTTPAFREHYNLLTFAVDKDGSAAVVGNGELTFGQIDTFAIEFDDEERLEGLVDRSNYELALQAAGYRLRVIMSPEDNSFMILSSFNPDPDVVEFIFATANPVEEEE